MKSGRQDHLAEIGQPAGCESSKLLTLTRNRNFRLLFVGQTVSQLGDGLLLLAAPWLILSLTNSAIQLSLGYFSEFAPIVLFGIVAGVLVDRWQRTRVMVAADLCRLSIMLSVPIAIFLGGLQAWQIFVVIFLNASLGQFFNPAKNALVPDIVDERDLVSANSLLNASGQFAFLIAPPLGNVLLSRLGPTGLFLVDAATFAVSLATIPFIRTRSTPGPEQAPLAIGRGISAGLRAFAAELRAGLDIVRGTRLIGTGIVLGAVLYLTASPIQVLLPLFIQRVKGGGAESFGFMAAAHLGGLLVGALTTPYVSGVINTGRLIVMATFGLGICAVIAPWPAGLLAPAIALFMGGICVATLFVMSTTIIQEATPVNLRGRVFALYNFSIQSVRPPAFLIAGALAEILPLRQMFAGIGGLIVIAGLVALSSRELRRAK